MILLILVVLVIIYLTINIRRRLLNNRQIHQFFQTKSRNLTILPNANILTGNLYQTIWNPRNFLQFQNLHKKYGKTFAFYMCTQPWVVTTDLDLIKIITIDEGDKHQDRLRLGAPVREFNDSIFQANGDDWRKARRAVAPSLTNHKVRSDMISSDIEDIVKQLKDYLALASQNASTADGSFEMDTLDMAKRYALAVILLVTYKRNHVVNFKNGPDPMVQGMEILNRIAANPSVLLSLMFPFLQPMLIFLVDLVVRTSNIHKIVLSYKTVIDFIDHILESAKSEDKSASRFQSNPLAKKGEEKSVFGRRFVDDILDIYRAKKIEHDKLKATLLFFFLAGFETTSATINHIIWQLAMHPQVQEKLRKSILEDGGFDSPYLLWCIQEGMRWHPAIPLGWGRVLASDLEYKGTLIPKGTFVTPSVFSIHHDPEVWPEPEKYDPDRWSKADDFHPAAFLGFGIGQRNCVGSKLALHEMKLVFEMILTNYRIEKCEKTPDDFTFTSPAMFHTIPDKKVIVRFVPIVELKK